MMIRRCFTITRRKHSAQPIFNQQKSLYSTNLFQQRLENASTIFALSSGHASGKASLQPATAVSVIRVSGPKASLVLEKMTRLSQFEPRKAQFCKLRHPESAQILDHAICVYFPSPNSFTGEDIVELHIHGGYSVQNDVLQALSRVDQTFQMAQPGDFTKRAFMNGKMDLTEVEALSDLLHAQTEQQRMQALRQLDGKFSDVLEKWSKDITYAVAHLTAYIDFGEDDDLDNDVYRLIIPRIQALNQEIKSHLKNSHKGERLRSGVQVALLGAPNAGKSSLLNALAKRPVAIVSDVQGTTRDIVEVHLNLGGYAVTVADTAGIREDNEDFYISQGISPIGDIEREGMVRALERAKSADILLLVMDPQNPSSNEFCLNKLREQQLKDQTVLIVHNKSDLCVDHGNDRANVDSEISLSCKTLEGMDNLVNQLSARIEHMFSQSQISLKEQQEQEEKLLITRERHKQHLQSCVEHLEHFLYAHAEIDLAAEHLRAAHGHIASITGHIDTEDILGIVFKEFCIGK